ncbi:sugar ABC transporter substrate-binding protein [Pusillimonas noertemannii]|uniref:Monosaccharide ABC transporter substrate-binding protein (CUT2 family) n=1 Tax=Pusillimonas noertemannii TaxID=305977 RepID=A0A2U1CNH4_9BURK|nr:sugar ABC transporter substrate-binding protein [Pusillimonas noertemannii]NYT68418.1 sugar ABC transporter substrate-binding protein [Pusillimonas noertemannii]PVY62565.1 monosaccharide ABC transporter substrate-binding protein (CUT2 family) [Pusillimonas noertemannii]TFL10486.1 sugar ABC transporter substrate-binding protein [Pusillimonas noertemannii]
MKIINIAASALLAAGLSHYHAFAQPAAQAVQAAKQPLSQWQKPPSAPPAQEGKTVYVVTCTSQGIGCVRAANGVKEAGELLGWSVRVVDGKGDPGTWNGAIQSAIAAGADGIVIDAVPPMLVGDALSKAANAKIPVVSIFNPVPDADSSVFAFVRPEHKRQGQLLAQWIIDDSGGQARILLVEDRQFPELAERVAGFKAEIAKCAKCEIVGNIESTIGTMAQRLASAVATELTRRPAVDYIAAPFDSNAFFVIEGVRQAGLKGKVKVAGYEGDPQAFEAIRNGAQAVTVANPAEWMGWQAVDELNRAFNGAKAVNMPIPSRLIDAGNVPDTKGWTGDVDYKARYEALWKRR